MHYYGDFLGVSHQATQLPCGIGNQFRATRFFPPLVVQIHHNMLLLVQLRYLLMHDGAVQEERAGVKCATNMLHTKATPEAAQSPWVPLGVPPPCSCGCTPNKHFFPLQTNIFHFSCYFPPNGEESRTASSTTVSLDRQYNT